MTHSPAIAEGAPSAGVALRPDLPVPRGRARRRALRIAFGMIALAWIAALAVPFAGADDEFRHPTPFWLTLQGGGMFPAGKVGFGLERGGQAVGSLGYQLNDGFVLSGDLGLVSSGDDAGTRIVLLGLNGRLNPNRDLRALYVQGGGGFYDIRYHARVSGLVPPPNKVRPGLSFGVGYEFSEYSRLTFGVLGMYHGILLARSDALAYVTLGLYASLRPSLF